MNRRRLFKLLFGGLFSSGVAAMARLKKRPSFRPLHSAYFSYAVQPFNSSKVVCIFHVREKTEL